VADPTQWTTTDKWIAAGAAAVIVVGAFVVLGGKATECPKLKRLWSDNWREYGWDMAEDTRRTALAHGCSWAEKPVRTDREIMQAGQG
jgi:hypothetical protein